jgi:ribonuclease R
MVGDPAKSGGETRPEPGDKVVVTLGEWNRRSDNLTGTITARLGRTHEPRAELLGIYLKIQSRHRIPRRRRARGRRPARPRQSLRPAGRLDYRDKVRPSPSTPTTPRTSTTRSPTSRSSTAAKSASASTSPTSPPTCIPAPPSTARPSAAATPPTSSAPSSRCCRRNFPTASARSSKPRTGSDKAVFLTFAKRPPPRDRRTPTPSSAAASASPTSRPTRCLRTTSTRSARCPCPPKHQTGSTGRALRELSDAELHDLQTWVRALWKIALASPQRPHGSRQPRPRHARDENLRRRRRATPTA